MLQSHFHDNFQGDLPTGFSSHVTFIVCVGLTFSRSHAHLLNNVKAGKYINIYSSDISISCDQKIGNIVDGFFVCPFNFVLSLSCYHATIRPFDHTSTRPSFSVKMQYFLSCPCYMPFGQNFIVISIAFYVRIYIILYMCVYCVYCNIETLHAVSLALVSG